MEKSIEIIWKEGFLNSDALVAPKINNLYNAKSIHIIDKIKRMAKINLMAIIAFSSIFLLVSFFIGIPIMGIVVFVCFTALAIINKSLLKSLGKIDKGVNSYEYLKSFSQWINESISVNSKMSMILYPSIIMSIIITYWLQDYGGISLGEKLVNEILIYYPDTIFVFGIPVIVIAIVVFILAFIAYFSDRLYKLDVNIVYGRVFNKMEELMKDIEELNS